MKDIKIESKAIFEAIDQQLRECEDLQERIAKIAFEKYLEIIAMNIAGAKFQAAKQSAMVVPGGMPPPPPPGQGPLPGPWKQ